MPNPITTNWPGRVDMQAEKRRKLEQQAQRLREDIAWRIANDIGHAVQDEMLRTVLALT